MATPINRVSQLYATGKMNINARTVPESVTGIAMYFTREGWPDTGGNVLSAQIDLSLDDGATWLAPYAGFTAAGGSLLDRGGDPVTESSVAIPLTPQVGGTQRQIRAEFEVFTDLTSAFRVETT